MIQLMLVAEIFLDVQCYWWCLEVDKLFDHSELELKFWLREIFDSRGGGGVREDNHYSLNVLKF